MTTLGHAVWTPETWRSVSWRYELQFTCENGLLRHRQHSMTPHHAMSKRVIVRRCLQCQQVTAGAVSIGVNGRACTREDAPLPCGQSCMHFASTFSSVLPESLHLRLMCHLQIRTQIANEMIDDLKDIAEENSLLMRESLFASLSLEQVVDHPLEQEPDQEPA